MDSDVQVSEGGRSMAKNTNQLGKCDFDGVPRAPRDRPQDEAALEVISNGSRNVGTQDKGTGQKEG